MPSEQEKVDEQVAKMVMDIRDQYELDVNDKAIVGALVTAFQAGVVFGKEIIEKVMGELQS